jgi:rhodanese-related sulfurtransferase
MLATFVQVGVAALAAATMSLAAISEATAQGSILRATLEETNQKTPEVSTEDVRRILADGSAILLDARKRSEYVAGHIAGAKNVAPPAGVSPSAYTAAVERLVGGDKGKALVLYCNGQHCQASRQLGDQLVAAGFSDVRRYQLGIPVWRALNGPIEIELEGIARIFGVDRTAVFFDARSSEEFAKGSLPGAHNIPIDAGSRVALGERAPSLQHDFNTRIVLFGRNPTQARALADAVAKTPYQNVSYFPGTFDELAAALKAQ